MKRIAFLAVALVILILLPTLASCNPYNADYTGLSDEELEVRRVADSLVAERYGISDISPYRVNITDHNDGTFTVSYQMHIYGYPAGETLFVSLGPDKTVMRISGSYKDYSPYLKVVTEKQLRAAEEKIMSKVGSTEDKSIRLYIDEEGYLCFYCEAIVDIPVDPTETDEHGNLMAGCGIDHEHRFYEERVCSKP